MVGYEGQDPYRVLGVSRGAPDEVVRAAYRALARQHHPDLGGDAVRMATVNRAWSILRDPARRRLFDRRLDPSRAMAGVARDPVYAGDARGPRAGSTVLDFGRHAGRSIREIAAIDPDYLEWLVRTPSGRAFGDEIGECLENASAAWQQPAAWPR